MAENPGCPPELLVVLVDDPNFHVRFAVLDHPRVDRRVHEAVCRSSDEDLRRVLAESGSFDDDIGVELLADPSAAVRAGLAANTTAAHTLAVLLRDSEPKVRAGAALNPRTTAEDRRGLARDKAAAVRMALVQSVELAEEDLQALAADRSTNVRWWLATVPWTPRVILRVLADDRSSEVSTQARIRLGLAEG
ncbi:hypothetical protein GVV04_26040 [Micromonospora sp. NEAU-HG-1]|nr:hypothetical protein [Micromonospora rubida]